MITINLLRRKIADEERDRRRCRFEASLVMSILVGTIAVCGFVWWDLDDSRANLQRLKEQKVGELAIKARMQRQLSDITVQIEDLQARSRLVARLADQQRRTIQLLDAVSRSLDPLTIWLSSLQMEREKILLMGFAKSKAHIVEFAELLKHEEIVQDVAILETGKTTENASVYGFSVNLQLMKEAGDVTPS